MLESLEIRGIRSFSPDLPNTIQFDPKLTLIQGHNGAGKTTIIESLKAVTSGIFPPCSDNGRSFIFDPRISNLPETHAVIKLQFLTSYNKPVAIVRKYTLTLRAAGRLEIKKAENIVKTLNDEEKEVQKSMRVSEIDKLVPELIGLSPSVLQYVTFCHQDEAYWPFSESGCLKTCLDQILNTETLSKAHDYHKKFLKKQKQNLVAKQGEVREMRSNTAYLKDYQTHMHKLTEERDKLLVQKRELEENLVGLNMEVKKFGRLQNLNQYLEQKISEAKTMKEHLNIPEWDSQRSEEEVNTELKEIEKKFAEADSLIGNVQNQLYQTIAELANLNRDLALTSEDIVNSQEIETELKTLLLHYKELTNQDYDTSQSVLFIESLETQYSNIEKEIQSSLESIRNKLKDLEYDSGRSIRELQDLIKQRESYQHKISQVQSSISNSETQPPNPLLASFETLCINISQMIHRTVELRNHLLQTLEYINDENTSSILEVIVGDLSDYTGIISLAYDQINRFKEENAALFRVSSKSDLQQGVKDKVLQLEERVKSISDKLNEIESIHKSYQTDIQSNTENMQIMRRRLEDHGLQKGYLTNIRSIIKSIETLQQKNINKEIILQRQEELRREIEDKSIEKENLSMFLLQQQEYKQELYRTKEAYRVEVYKAQDYKKYKISMEKILQLENEISDTQQKLKEWDPDRLLVLKDQESNLKSQISQLQGRLAQMEIELSKKPPFMPPNIHMRANRAWLECKILEQSINEHTSLLKHLDNTIIQYHQSKIEQINSILKSLWQKTYKGYDIEAIFLKAEPDNMNKGRSYNYRLLLQGVSGEMEMRGRCSAGQRVLASIIIRIALAQAFSSGVSILTLDEPTTNLDEANTEGLAESIATLVSQERALQLIVISHDEAFIQKLKRLTGYATYFRLEKQARSSVIRKVSGYNS
jgi:DNA repair protein RAD50